MTSNAGRFGDSTGWDYHEAGNSFTVCRLYVSYSMFGVVI